MAGCPSRPALRWHGGKWLLAPWVIEHFGPHRVYVEPYGGAASVLLRKPRTYAEIYNDLDQSVVNLFSVLRSDRAGELIDKLRLTPFARTEFRAAYEPAIDPVERARRLIIRSFMGHGSNGHARSTGFRANSNRSGTTPAKDWDNLPDAMLQVIDRFQGVIIESKNAIDVMQQHDSRHTLHYVDPPYMFETRSDLAKDYAFELTDADHVALLETLKSLEGLVVLSGYPSALYDEHLIRWKRIERTALADGARKRTEVLWLNECAVAAQPAADLFD